MAATQGLPAHFFDALQQSTSSKEGILYFLGELDPSLPSKKPEAILWDLMNNDESINHCLELVLSSGPWADALDEWLRRTFTSPPSEPCVHIAVLSRLISCAFFSDTQSASHDAKVSVKHDLNFVSHAPAAIQKLLQMSINDDGRSNAEVNSGRGKTSPRKKTQAERKKQSHAERKKKVTKAEEEADVFQALGGLTVPDSPAAAHELISHLASKLKDLLPKYLGILRTEAIADSILSSFVTQLAEATPRHVKGRLRSEPIITNVQVEDIVSPIALSAFDKPLKAALYFDSADDFGDWEIFLSGRAIRDIRVAQRRDRASYEIIMKKIKELSHSHFSDDNQKPLTGGKNAVPVFEAKMTSDSRLVYQIDCLPDYSGEQERQVIRVFGVYTHAQLNRVWESLGYQLAAMGGQEYRARCCKRVLNNNKTLFVPAIFPPNKSDGQDSLPIPELPKEDLEEIHSILVLEKFVGFSKELRNSFIAELDVQHVFNLSSKEMEIIEHPHSCYVLGRSGTGKTTTMLFKMLGLERTFLTLGNEKGAKPRQLFVTQSPVLANRVEDYFARLFASLSLGQKSESELRDLATQKALGRVSQAPKSMVHKKDMRWRVDLPTRFSLLQEEHFPLFLTFDRLMEMIIGDVLATDNPWLTQQLGALDAKELAKFESLIRVLSATKDVLRYPTFLADYWAHFPQNLIKGLDPALVFSEIIGVIKGAEKSVSSKGRFLDKPTYLSLSDRTNYLFASQRERIYDLFIKYARMKRELGGFDAADRTHAILEVFNLIGVPGTRVEFLYVDEAQDNMLIDAMLLRSICKNPLGLFWAGDTAQTIAIGNSFRFQDLKAFLHRLEERRAQSLLDAVRSPAQEPASFSLDMNYRSHGGIIACARSTVEILTRFWPTSLDKMAPEKGIVDGIKPLFLSSTSVGGLQFRDLMTRGGESDIEFGAAQCILVRDGAARQRLLNEVGEIGIIMPLYDSKGLEFDDVLLYNFFEDSTLDIDHWRVLLNLLPGQIAPQFDEARHAGLCSELKFLYVAVTRARKKLWVYDGSNKARPLQTVWTSLGLIDKFDQSQQLPQFASASSRQEWRERAEDFFDRENYYEAVTAFKFAGLTQQANVAKAYRYRKEAEMLIGKPSRKRRYQAAASLFSQCAEDAAETGDHTAFHGIAGLCWSQAEDYARAAASYEAGEQYANALRMYQKVAMFDEGMQILQDHRADIGDEIVVDGFKEAARVFYLKDKKLSKAEPLFASKHEALVYTEENPFLDESRALLLKDMGKPGEAADVHLAEGRLLEAVKVLLEDSTSTFRARELIVQGLWKAMPFGNLKSGAAKDTLELIQWASRFNFTGPMQDKAAMFLALDCSDWAQARVLGRRFLFRRADHMSALLCFSYALHPSNLPNIRRWGNRELAEILSDFLDFCLLLRYHAENLDLQHEGLQQLFNFRPAKVESTYVVPPGSWLHDKLNQPGGQSGEPIPPASDTLVASATLHDRLKNGIFAFIALLIDHQSKECQNTSTFTPCIRFLLEDSCRYRGGCFHHHVPYSEISHQWLSTQVRIHLQQIILCQVLESIPKELGGGYCNRKFWVRQLHHTLNPPTPALGSWTCVNFSFIPESNKAVGIVRSWCRDILDGYRTRKREEQAQELSILYQVADLCFHLDKQEASQYVHGSRMAKRLRYQPIFHRPGKIYTIPELLGSLDASHPWFLRGGLLFARHALDARLFIDANVLCTFMEFLTSAFVLAHHGICWHNITLPRKQILHLHRRLRRVSRPELRGFAPDLLEVWRRILLILVTGENSEYFLYPGGNLVYSDLLRLFVPRVCQAICLVGYNIPHEPLRNNIMKILEPLALYQHPLYRSFALARSWKGVKSALRNPKRPSPLDDLVELWSDDARNVASAPPKGVTRVVFKKIEDIPKLLLKALPPVTVPETPYLPASNSKPALAQKPDLVPNGPSSAVPPSDAAGEYPDVGSGLETALESDNTTASGITAPVPTVNMAGPEEVVVYTSEQREKAVIICYAYRACIRERLFKNARSRREVACRTFFEACLKQIGKVKWPPTLETSTYQKLYLGVVPHLLVVIQWVQMYVSQEKPAAKGALKAARGLDFEEGMARVIQLNFISKTLEKLHKVVEPQAQFHAKANLKELRKIVVEVEQLLEQLPKAQSCEVEFDMSMAKSPVKELVIPRPFIWDQKRKRYYYGY